jgi:hypothetical protein
MYQCCDTNATASRSDATRSRSYLGLRVVQRTGTVKYEPRIRSVLDLQLISNRLQPLLDLGGPFFCSGNGCFTLFT